MNRLNPVGIFWINSLKSLVRTTRVTSFLQEKSGLIRQCADSLWIYLYCRTFVGKSTSSFVWGNQANSWNTPKFPNSQILWGVWWERLWWTVYRYFKDRWELYWFFMNKFILFDTSISHFYWWNQDNRGILPVSLMTLSRKLLRTGYNWIVKALRDWKKHESALKSQLEMNVCVWKTLFGFWIEELNGWNLFETPLLNLWTCNVSFSGYNFSSLIPNISSSTCWDSRRHVKPLNTSSTAASCRARWYLSASHFPPAELWSLLCSALTLE